MDTKQASNGIHLSFKLLLLLALLVFGARLQIIDAYSSFLPVYDDWGIGGLLQEYQSGDLPFEYLFNANNGHIGLWRDILQIFVFDLNQSQWDTRLQMTINAAIWAGCAIFLIKVLTPYFTGISTSLSTLMILVLWIFPTSLTNATWGVQTHNYIMITFTVMAFWYMTGPAPSKAWFAGIAFTIAAPLSMGGGALVAPVVLALLLLRLIFDKRNRKQLTLTAVVALLLTIYAIWITSYASDGAHNNLVARSALDFLITALKALSYPLHRQIWPSILLLLPLCTLLVQVIRNGGWNDRSVLFVLSLSGYAVGLAASIGYARGVDGMNLSDRYFEFLQLYTLAGFLSLLILHKRQYRLSTTLYTALLLSWGATFITGAATQVSFTNDVITRFATEKPTHENVVKDYLHTRAPQAVLDLAPADVPYPSNRGLIHFIDKVTQEDILSYQLQVPQALIRESVSTAFVINGTTRSTGEAYRHFHSDVMGSFDRQNGGNAADGTYVSQIFATNRNGIMIPVTGHLGYPDMSLQLVDLETELRTDIIPLNIGRDFIEGWQEVFVPTPENAFRIIATDNNPERWFAFGAPRTIGKLSLVSNWLISHGQLLWQLALLGILLMLIDIQKLRSRLCR